MSERWLDIIEERARAVLPEPVFRYFAQGARAGVTAGEAVAAWDALRLAPRVLRDVTEPHTATSLLGTPVNLPLGLAPTTLQRAAHRDGDVGMAAAVAEAGALLVVSSNTGTRFGEIAATGVNWWLQAYLPQDRSLVEPLLDRAVDAGAKAIVLTLDTPVVGTKYDDGCPIWDSVDPGLLRVNFDPTYAEAPRSAKALDLGAADLAWLGERTGLPVVAKGVLRPDDARRCVHAGAAAIWVSNHGGRQLDFAAATARVLPAIASSVDGGAEIYVDGGIRSGLHLLVATALGAHAAFIGRPALYALAADGQAGLTKLLDELAVELTEAMRLTGCNSLADAPGTVLDEHPYGR